MSTRQELRRAEVLRRKIALDYYNYFLGLLHNVLEFDNLPADLPKRYILRVLLSKGEIGHYNGLFLPVTPIGIDVYGLPTEYTLIGYNGVTFTRKATDVSILRINDQAYPIVPFLKIKSQQLADIECSITQNLNAVKVMRIYECADQATLLSLQNTAKAVEIGAVNAFVTKNALNQATNVLDTGADYLCDKFIALKSQIMNEVYTRLGIVTANTEKRERVQSMEVNASMVSAIDSIMVVIDTFNYDAEVAGLPIRMKLNSYTQDILNEESEENE